MTYRCADSITPANLPTGYDAYLGYRDGSWPDFNAEVARFPRAHVVGLAVTANDDAEGLDIETRDATPPQGPPWARRQIARGIWRPILYAGAATMTAVITDLGAMRPQVRLWSAHYTYHPHICAPTVCGYPAVDGTQWTDKAAGLNGSLIDESLLAADFFKASAPKPVARYVEEPMMLNKGKDAITPIALPANCTRVRFFASQAAVVEVDLRDGKGETRLNLSYAATMGVDVPQGCDGIVAHRVDAGSNDVSCTPLVS